MPFVVIVHDAADDADDLYVYDSAEDAANDLGVEWEAGYKHSKFTHRADIPRGDYFARTDDKYTGALLEAYNGYEPVYARARYAEKGEKVQSRD